mmetsp:Transcript_21988/g.65755  ORF Transcript_21988/g.65755 Transcript_21988/m.65755 type:complete len:292 (+) Transcript_21988:564-1439(+)
MRELPIQLSAVGCTSRRYCSVAKRSVRPSLPPACGGWPLPMRGAASRRGLSTPAKPSCLVSDTSPQPCRAVRSPSTADGCVMPGLSSKSLYAYSGCLVSLNGTYVVREYRCGASAALLTALRERLPRVSRYDLMSSAHERGPRALSALATPTPVSMPRAHGVFQERAAAGLRPSGTTSHPRGQASPRLRREHTHARLVESTRCDCGCAALRPRPRKRASQFRATRLLSHSSCCCKRAAAGLRLCRECASGAERAAASVSRWNSTTTNNLKSCTRRLAAPIGENPSLLEGCG